MRIAIIGNLAVSMVRFRGHLIKELVGHGHTVHAFAPDYDATTRAQVSALGARPHAFDLDRTGLNPARDLWTFSGLARALRQIRPEVVLAYTLKPVLYGLTAARLAGVRNRFAMIAGRGSMFDTSTRTGVMRARLITGAYRAALSGAKAVFFQNDTDRRFFVYSKIVTEEDAFSINGSGVDVDHFAFSPVPRHDGTTVFLLVARLIAPKGIREYAAAGSRLREAGLDCQLRLVGPPDTNPHGILESELATWHEQGAISYMGSTSDVREALRDAHVFVLPSYYQEGRPRTLLEALAVGRPIITTDHPGCRETVEEGLNGRLVAPRNVESLYSAMRWMHEHPGSLPQMGSASRKIAERDYRVEQVSEAIISTLHKRAVGKQIGY